MTKNPASQPDQQKARIADARLRLYRTALAWCGDSMLADDLVQETIVTAIEKYAQLRDPKCLFPWMYKILNNKWYRHIKKELNSADSLDDELPSEEPSPSGQCQELELVAQVRRAVSTLPIKERQVISLVDLEELSYCEVAIALDIPIGTVMSRLHRARKQLLDKLDNSQIGTEPNNRNLYRVK